MPQEDLEKDEDDALRKFIDRLETWPEDEPPSTAELRALRREIRLTQDDRDKLEILSENHIRRARAALDAGSYDLAAAELARAAQLRPLDPRPKTELAGIYLQRSLERGYGRNDRTKAIRLARKALELNPGDPEAQAFLKEYRQMNADFRSARYRRYWIPGLAALVVLINLAVWQRDWVVDFITPSGSEPVSPTTTAPPAVTEGGSRDIGVNLPGNGEGGVETEVLRSVIGRRNDSSYVDIRGRISTPATTVGAMKLVVRGRNGDGQAVFALPVTLRDESDPLLRPGDSQAMTIFRWLADDESRVDSLDLEILELDILEDPPPYDPTEAEMVWDVPRPDGAGLAAEVRDLQVYEAFDRQVVVMDLALSNTGVHELSELSVGVSLGSEWTPSRHRGVGSEEASLKRGERRVIPVAMGFPLDADLENRQVTVRVTEAAGTD